MLVQCPSPVPLLSRRSVNRCRRRSSLCASRRESLDSRLRGNGGIGIPRGREVQSMQALATMRSSELEHAMVRRDASRSTGASRGVGS
jgi:hypothetical protein